MFLLVFSLFYSISISSLYAFNYQTVEHWRYLKQEKLVPESSYFGYSLAVHRSSLLVGAPRDHSSHDHIARRGAVWRCDFHANYKCQRVPFRLDGEANVRVGTSFDNKTGQWLGASLAANDGNIIAGTPFLKHRIKDGRNLDYEIPGGALIGKFGTSSTMANSTQIFSPSFLNWHSRNYNQEGYGEFGFQVALSKRPERLLITSPGSFYFRGGVHSLPILEGNYTDTRHPFTSPHYQWRDAGWLRYPSNYSSDEYDDWCYRGYALAVGNFNHDDLQEIAVSVPKLDRYRGAVEIINSNLDKYPILTLNGVQMGEYFGASLCVVDLNNDGLDDLLVGAPLFTVKKDGRIIPDAGRVDVFYQTREHRLIKKQTIEGTREGGRLGHALTNLGDIDQDGYKDIAVSVPFANHGYSGTVHIYRGSKDGLVLTPSQILQAPSLKGFGWSLQGQFDFDNNSYADLAVGSIHSETVAIILSRPVLRLQTRLNYSSPTIPLNCTSHSDERCFILKLCIRLTNRNSSLTKGNEVVYELHLDKDKERLDKRVMFRESYQSSKRRQFKLSSHVCHEYSLYIKKDVNDKLRPIRIHVNYSLVLKTNSNVLSPILDPESAEFDHKIPIQKDCGSDDICTPELRIVTSTWPDDYKVGLTPKILLNINVTNKGENAYDTQCFIQLPAGVEYVSANSSSIMNLYCNLLKQSDRVVICQLGNPLPANGDISVQVHVAVNNYSAIEADPFVFLVNVTSDNPNTVKLTTEILLPISSSPVLVLTGIAEPEQIVPDAPESGFSRYRSSAKPNDLEIVHTYTLHNNGPGDAKRTEVKLMWPMLPATGYPDQTPLIYGLDLPTVIRVSDPRAKNDRCQMYQSSSTSIPAGENDRSGGDRPFLEKIRSSVTNNLIPQEASTIDPFQDSTLPIYCPGSLCRTFICHIDTLPIGHSLLIQLKGTLRYNHFQSKFDRSKSFVIVSNASAQVREIPLNISRNKSLQHATVQLKLETQIPPAVERSSQNWLWLIGISVTAGVILLIILVGVLWCCGFFKRNRPKYPSSTRDDEPLQDPYHLSSNQPAGGLPLQAESDELSSENNDDPEMMIDHPIDSLPIIVPQRSSHFIQQQQQRTQLPY